MAVVSSGTPWEEAGRRVSDALDGCCAVIVTGGDTVAAAEVALGIARMQARRRRVAVADLVGDVAPLRALVPEEDAHGIVDSFQYGVSLNKVARQVDEIGNLYVMPSGTEPLDHAEILRSDRWRRLTSGFREVEALLLLVAPLDVPGLDALALACDGFVTVGAIAAGLPPASRVLAEVPVPRTTRRVESPAGSLLDDEAATAPAARADDPYLVAATQALAARDEGPGGAGDDRLSELRRGAPAEAEPRRRRPWIVPALLALVALLAGAGAWLARRGADATPAPVVRHDSTPPAPAAAPAAAPARRDTAPLLPITNPTDSAAASAWAVEVVMSNTEAGAALRVRDLAGAPVVTWSPVVLAGDSGRWYRVTVGSYPQRSSADSLLRELRTRGLVASDGGSLLRAPLSLALERVARDSLPTALGRWTAKGVSPFALLGPDGRATLYAGMFETPDQASILATSLQAAGIAPVVAYRTGRLF